MNALKYFTALLLLLLEAEALGDQVLQVVDELQRLLLNSLNSQFHTSRVNYSHPRSELSIPRPDSCFLMQCQPLEALGQGCATLFFWYFNEVPGT